MAYITSSDDDDDDDDSDEAADHKLLSEGAI